MRVIGHRICGDDGTPLPFRQAADMGGALAPPRFVIAHYTAGASHAADLRTLTEDDDVYVSAHVVISRAGEVTQTVSFDRVAWHAGRSAWDGLTGLNRHSLGIEFSNAGRLTRKDGRWIAWWGGAVPEGEVLVARHKNEDAEAGWQTYPEPQIAAGLALVKALAAPAAYPIEAVLGHDDIAPGRKSDPGPAFPMERFMEALT